jgi:hypothetical protein
MIYPGLKCYVRFDICIVAVWNSLEVISFTLLVDIMVDSHMKHWFFD